MHDAHHLPHLGDPKTPLTGMKVVFAESTEFIKGARYDSQNKDNMADVRREVWAKKIGEAKAAPERKSIPPTTAAFHGNVKRTHYTGFNLEEC